MAYVHKRHVPSVMDDLQELFLTSCKKAENGPKKTDLLKKDEIVSSLKSSVKLSSANSNESGILGPRDINRS